MHVFKDWNMQKEKKRFLIYSKVGKIEKKNLLFYHAHFCKQKENSIYANEIPQMTYSMCKWKAITDLLRINNMVHIVMNILLCGWFIRLMELLIIAHTQKKTKSSWHKSKAVQLPFTHTHIDFMGWCTWMNWRMWLCQTSHQLI